MSRTIASRLLTAILIILALILINGDRVRSASAPPVSRAVIEAAQKAGQVRVIVELAVRAAAQSMVDGDTARNLRRAEVAQARASVRASLLGTKHSVAREYEQLPFIALEVGPDGLRAVESLQSLVIRVVEDNLNRPFLDESVPLVQADRLWAGDFAGIPFDGSGTVVAVLDTGVNKNHRFLRGKVVEEACFSSNNASLGATSVCPGGVTESFAAGSAMPCRVPNDAGCEHGTHVAGIAAGRGSAFSGVAKGANIMAVQVFSRFDDPFICDFLDPCIRAFDSDVLAGLERVYLLRATHNFASVNLSLGGGQHSNHCNGDIRKTTIDLLRSAGIATVIASGNDFFTNAISAPACISTSVSVGSTDDGSSETTQDVVSFFSNSAAILSLLAPGQWINSSVTPGGFAEFRGTSMAAPHVAGAFALLKEIGPDFTVAQMIDCLQKTGVPVLDTRNRITKPRIQVFNSLSCLPDVIGPGRIADLRAGPATQTSVTLNWTAPEDGGSSDMATAYDLRFATSQFTAIDWRNLIQVFGEPLPARTGNSQSETVNNLLCGRSYFFGIKAVDEEGNESILSNIASAKTAACNKLAVSPTRLPGAEQNVPYKSGTINITNGTPPYNLRILTSTSADISYDPASNSFKGTPTVPGRFRITGIVSDGVGSERKVSFSGSINNPVQITTKALRNGRVNVPYRTTLKAKYGVKPYEWEVVPDALLLADFEFDKTTGKATLLAPRSGPVELKIKVRSLTGGTANKSLTVEFK